MCFLTDFFLVFFVHFEHSLLHNPDICFENTSFSGAICQFFYALKHVCTGECGWVHVYVQESVDGYMCVSKNVWVGTCVCPRVCG